MFTIDTTFKTQQDFNERAGKVLDSLAHGASLLIDTDGKISSVSTSVEGISKDLLNNTRAAFVTFLERNSSFLEQYEKYVKVLGENWTERSAAIGSRMQLLCGSNTHTKLLRTVLQTPLPKSITLAARQHTESMDVTFVTADKQTIRAHSAVLQQSNYFKALFEDVEGRNSIPLSECTKQEMEEVLDFRYTGHIQDVSIEKLLNLLRIAHHFELDDLTERCKAILDSILISLPPSVIPILLVYAKINRDSPDVRTLLLHRFNNYARWGDLSQLTSKERELLHDFCGATTIKNSYENVKTTPEELIACANCYLRGIGTKQNLTIAFNLIILAFQKSNDIFKKKYPNEKEVEFYLPAVQLGMEMLETLSLNVSAEVSNTMRKAWRKAHKIPDGDGAAQAKAFKQQGDISGITLLGDHFLQTKPELAMKYYEMAATYGDSVASYKLGQCYRHGTGVKQDLEKTFEWYKRSAIQGNVKGMFFLMCCYSKGMGTQKNAGQAKILAKQILEIGVETLDIPNKRRYEFSVMDEIIVCLERDDKEDSTQNGMVTSFAYLKMLHTRQHTEEMLVELVKILRDACFEMRDTRAQVLRLDEPTMDCEIVNHQGESVPVHGFIAGIIESKELHASIVKKGTKGAGVNLTTEQIRQVLDFVYNGTITNLSPDQMMTLHDAVKVMLPTLVTYCQQRIKQILYDKPMDCFDMMLTYWGHSQRSLAIEILLLEKFIETVEWASIAYSHPQAQDLYKMCISNQEHPRYVLAAASCLYVGWGVPKDQNKAITIIAPFVKGDYRARFYYYKWQREHGLSLKEDGIQEAIQEKYGPALCGDESQIVLSKKQSYQLAALQGFGLGNYMLGQCELHIGNREQFFQNMKIAGEKGFFQAHFALYEAHQKEIVHEPQLRVSYNYCQLLESAGIAWNIAKIYAYGFGIKRSTPLARNLASRALVLGQLDDENTEEAIAFLASSKEAEGFDMMEEKMENSQAGTQEEKDQVIEEAIKMICAEENKEELAAACICS
ncbi:MAG: BTB/POZ domain-containing protein [Parachlamydiaceae bacterium]|nr:BTB/POZ domain-containing protein [Parachlamydiaceae bacterium]